MAFEHYIQKGTKRLRMGFTTGSCAALAAKAAALTLLTGKAAETVEINTPKGLTVKVPVLELVQTPDAVRCAVKKDAGDDPDITDGALVFAEVTKTDRPNIVLDGGAGVGRVTRPGLNQPVGAAAINDVPRQMIEAAVRTVCDELFYEGGLSIVISVPDGVRLAQKTFNPRLGIEGGISILGTSGIVEPMSAQALIDTIGLELRALAAAGQKRVVLTPGNYGGQFPRVTPVSEERADRQVCQLYRRRTGLRRLSRLYGHPVCFAYRQARQAGRRHYEHALILGRLPPGNNHGTRGSGRRGPGNGRGADAVGFHRFLY